MGTRQECPHTSGATSTKDAEPSTRGLKSENAHHEGAWSEEGRRSLTTEGPQNKNAEESISWHLPARGPRHGGYGVQAGMNSHPRAHIVKL